MCCDENNLFDDNDDCYEPDVIDDYEYTLDYDEYDIDEYWAKGWQTDTEGFRRFDSDVHKNRDYRVFPTRFRLKDFKLSKSLRRVLNKNRDLKTVIRSFRPTEGKDDLYTAHLHARFEKKHPRYSLRNGYDYLKYAYHDLMEVCIFDGEKLVACSIFEMTGKSGFGSRAFWDVTKPSRSLGILTVLLEMQYLREKGREFYYLGHFFEQNPVYQYKARFPACELWDWDNERWIDYRKENERIKEMFNHKFQCKDDLEKDPKFTISLFQAASEGNPHILASALVGSRARGTEREDSDFDLIILTDKIEEFFKDDFWVKCFHRWRESKIEDWGAVKTIRAFYKNGDVYEFNFAAPSWAETNPLDEGTRRVVKDGMKILYDPQGILEKLQTAVSGATKISS